MGKLRHGFTAFLMVLSISVGVAHAAQVSSQEMESYPQTVRAKFDKPTFLERHEAQEISYTMAVDMASAGDVDSVTIESENEQMYVRTKAGKVYWTTALASKVTKDFEERGVETWVESGSSMRSALQTMMLLSNGLLLILMVFAIGYLAIKFMGTPARRLKRKSGLPKVTFADVAGQEEAKSELMEVIELLRNPKKYAHLGAQSPRGVLLKGDPGNGKTLLARAVAGEAGADFLHLAGSDVLEVFAGLGARRIRQMFKLARRKKMCILFIDEIEVIAGKRGGGNGSDVQHEREQIVDALLVEMDGVDKTGNVVVIGATNRAAALDPAVLRPGRFDRHIDVPKPDFAGRCGILEVHTRKVPLASNVNVKILAQMTVGFSGAEIANLCNEAAINAGRRQMATVDLASFDAARDRILLGTERKTSTLNAKEEEIVSIHEAGHALVGVRVAGIEPVYKATIAMRGGSLGLVMRLPLEDVNLHSVSYMESVMAVTVAGRAAEALMRGEGEVTDGALSDISQATMIARSMIGRFGMSKELGMVAVVGEDGRMLASEATGATLDRLVRETVEKAYAQAMGIIRNEQLGLITIAKALREKRTLTGEEVSGLADMALRAKQQGISLKRADG